MHFCLCFKRIDNVDFPALHVSFSVGKDEVRESSDCGEDPECQRARGPGSPLCVARIPLPVMASFYSSMLPPREAAVKATRISDSCAVRLQSCFLLSPGHLSISIKA